MVYTAYEASELFMGIMEILAAVMIQFYTRDKVKLLPPEEKREGIPLHLTGGGMMFLGLGSLMRFLAAFFRENMWIVDAIALWNFTILFYLFLVLGALLMSYASLIILEKQRWLWVLILLFIITFVTMFSLTLLGWSPETIEFITNYPARMLFIIPIFIWGYIAKTTKTASSVGITYLAIITPTYAMFLYVTEVWAVGFVIVLRLLAPAFIGASFYLKRQDVSLELFLYAASYASTGIWMTFMIVNGVGDLFYAIRIIIMGMVSLIGLGTGAYSYGRWRSNKATPTLLLFLFFEFSGLGWVFVAIRDLGVLNYIELLYLPVITGMIGSMFMALSVFTALDWKRPTLLPLVVSVPTILLLISWYPQDPHNFAIYRPMIMITNIVNLTLPIVLYFMLWRRMSKLNRPGRMRPLSLSIGLIIVTAGNVGGRASQLPLSLFVFLGMLVIWLGLTGRLDRWLVKTEGSSP